MNKYLQIYTTQTIYDRETKDKYNLTVTCFDSLSTFSTKKLMIWVRDENDHSPKFTENVYVLSLVHIYKQVVHRCNTVINYIMIILPSS